MILRVSTSEYSPYHWHTVVLQSCQKKSAPSSVFLSLLALSWGDFKLPRYSIQNTARDFPLSWNQLSFCSGVSFWLTHLHTYMTQTLSPKTPCRQKEEQMPLFSLHPIGVLEYMHVPNLWHLTDTLYCNNSHWHC